MPEAFQGKRPDPLMYIYKLQTKLGLQYLSDGLKEPRLRKREPLCLAAAQSKKQLRNLASLSRGSKLRGLPLIEPPSEPLTKMISPGRAPLRKTRFFFSTSPNT